MPKSPEDRAEFSGRIARKASPKRRSVSSQSLDNIKWYDKGVSKSTDGLSNASYISVSQELTQESASTQSQKSVEANDLTDTVCKARTQTLSRPLDDRKTAFSAEALTELSAPLFFFRSSVPRVQRTLSSFEDDQDVVLCPPTSSV